MIKLNDHRVKLIDEEENTVSLLHANQGRGEQRSQAQRFNVDKAAPIAREETG